MSPCWFCWCFFIIFTSKLYCCCFSTGCLCCLAPVAFFYRWLSSTYFCCYFQVRCQIHGTKSDVGTDIRGLDGAHTFLHAIRSSLLVLINWTKVRKVQIIQQDPSSWLGWFLSFPGMQLLISEQHGTFAQLRGFERGVRISDDLQWRSADLAIASMRLEWR